MTRLTILTLLATLVSAGMQLGDLAKDPKKAEPILNRLHVAQPKKRDNVDRPEMTPKTVKDGVKKQGPTVKELQDMSLGDLKIVEDLSVEMGASDVLETEDTMTLLDNYIDEIDLRVDKSNVKAVLRSLYTEALEL